MPSKRHPRFSGPRQRAGLDHSPWQLKWRSRQDLHLRPPPSHGGARILLSFGSMKRWSPWQDSHPHWLASKASVSALDYKGKSEVPAAGIAPAPDRF